MLIERFTLADANTLDYRITVNDPKVYTGSWTARLPIPREDATDIRVRLSRRETRCRTCLPDRVRKRSVALKRRRAARRFEYVEPARGGGAGRGAGAGGGRGGGRGNN